MKLSVCVQTDEVEPRIPVALFTGTLAERAAKAAAAGASGLELMTVDPRRLDAGAVAATLARHGLQVNAVGSGGIAFATGLTLLHPDAAAAAQAAARLADLIDFAATIGAPLVTIGSFRGRAGANLAAGRDRLGEILQHAADRATALGVRLVLEVMNRYEVDLLNTTSEGLSFLDSLGHRAVGLLLDTFHMNIEETSWVGPFQMAAASGRLWQVHIGDNNRQPPGRGMIDFPHVVGALAQVGYTGYLSAELLAGPDGDQAGRETLAYLRPLIDAAVLPEGLPPEEGLRLPERVRVEQLP